MNNVDQNPYPAGIDPSVWKGESFPHAAIYRDMQHSMAGCLRESTTRRKAFAYSERHLHCVWYDPTLRPATLRTRHGEPVIVENPGIWNQEAGPDFLGAVARIGRDQRRVAGDVEVHVHPSDWTSHGHGTDPRYRQVRFHVTYFPGSSDDIDRIPGAEQIVLKDALAGAPGFSFDHIDPTAYPYAARADMPPCSLVLQQYTQEQRLEVLRSAGEERLRRKSERIRQLIHEIGAEQTLYIEVMAALGYKHNKAAFRHVATLLPVEELRQISQGNARTAYALLMGLAGLLPAQPRSSWSDETHRWIRSLWDQWWRFRELFATRGTAPEWRLAGVRPANHPARRLMGAALLFCDQRPAGRQWEDLARRHPADWVERWIRHVTSLQDPYLCVRASLTGQPQAKTLALIGDNRAAAILANVLIPYLAAIDGMQGIVSRTLESLPHEADNAIVRQTAFYLFGRDHSPELRRPTLARQGLMQIFQDFCVNDRSRCANCAFPGALRDYFNHAG